MYYVWMVIYYTCTLTSTPINALQLQQQNDREAKSIDSIFAEKQEREEQIRQLEREIDEEKRAAEHVVSSMEPASMEKYQALKEENNRIEKV